MPHFEERYQRAAWLRRGFLNPEDPEGLEGPEVCAILDLTEANQRVLLHRARARIRARLEVAMGGR